MLADKFVLHKKKLGCALIGILIFFVAGIVVAVMNAISNFSFSSVLAGLLIIAVCGGLGYFIVWTNIINNPPIIILRDDGFETIGLGMSIKQTASWGQVESVDVAFESAQNQNVLTIKMLPPKTNIPIPEKEVDNFEQFAASVKAHFLVYKSNVLQAVLQMTQNEIKPDAKPRRKSTSASTKEVVFDREERIEQPALGATFIYKIYNAPDAASAQAFLAKNPVNEAHLYLLVNTPEGTTYCRDIQGTYTQ